MSHMSLEPMSNRDLDDMIAEHDRLCPNLPIHQLTLKSINNYVSMGLEPGGFVTAVLANDLQAAMARADSYNRATIFQICQYIYSRTPAQCHGSYERVEEWMNNFTKELGQ